MDLTNSSKNVPEHTHAFLSPSGYSWVNYDDDRLIERFKTHTAAQLGTRLHLLAEELINLRRKQPNTADAFNLFVNDAIGFKMLAEKFLYYSEYCHGTADALSFKDKELRIHDLKTGVSKASPLQLEIYAAIFCLEYKIKPKDIKITLRIYQFDKFVEWNPPTQKIITIMQKIKRFDTIIKKHIKSGG